jgi:predicted nucleic acid-binding protein
MLQRSNGHGNSDVARYLVDKSAYARLHLRPVADRLDPIMLDGQVAVTGIGLIEILYSARTSKEFERDRQFLAFMPRVAVTERIIDRALDIQGLMVANGTHRAVGVPDLVLAACAEAYKLTILHYDADFDLIATVTEQATEWVVPSGTL